jgi:tetratricopeptide (TPR) repeat protein
MGRKKLPMNDTPADRSGPGKGLPPLRQSPSRDGLKKTASSVFTLVPVFIVLLVSLATYFNALSCDFVYDDIDQIVNNLWIRNMRNIATIFSGSVWSFQPDLGASNYYRPLMYVVYMLDYHLFGMKPWGFHLVNVLFHCGVSVLIYIIAARLIGRPAVTSPSLKSVTPLCFPLNLRGDEGGVRVGAEGGGVKLRGGWAGVLLSPPFIAAVLFASHPIHTEAVTWIAGLPDVAFAFFYLLSFYLYIVFRDGRKRVYLLSILSFAAATLFKEPALTLPVLLIAYDWLLGKFDNNMLKGIKTYGPYIVVSCGYLFMRYHALRGFAPKESFGNLSSYQLVINVFPLFSEYLESLLWPFNLNLWHTFHPISSLLEAPGMISILVVVIFLGAAAAAYRKNKVIVFSLILMVVPLLPVFYIKAISWKPFAERYLYLPSVGYALLLAVFFPSAAEKLRLKRAARGITIAFIILWGAYTVGTITRNNVWQNSFNLWSNTVRKSPGIADAHIGLGDAYSSRGLIDMAIEQYRIASSLKPDYAKAHNNLGIAYSKKGLTDMAIEQYQIALSLKPDYAKARNNLGIAYSTKGLTDLAIEQYRMALSLEQDNVEARNNLGIAYSTKGLTDLAIEQYRMALSLKPDYVEAHNNLGNVYYSKGQLDMAIEQYRMALSLKPDYVEAYNNLGNVYYSKGQLDMAIGQFQAALSLKPDYAEAHSNLGLMYLKKGARDMARREVETALRLRPDLAEARLLLDEINSGGR